MSALRKFAKMKILSIIALFLFGIVFNGHAATKSEYDMKKADELKAELVKRFPAGSPRRCLEYFLSEKKIEHSYVPKERKIYAIIPKIGRYRIIYDTSLLIRVQFDQDDKVQRIEFDYEHTGL
jgi:hypothetical protein